MTGSNLIAAAKSHEQSNKQRLEDLKQLRNPKRQEELKKTLDVNPELLGNISFSVSNKVEELNEEELAILATANDFVLFLKKNGVPEKKIKQIEDLMYDKAINEVPEEKETTENLKSKIETLVEKKKVKLNNYPGSATDYLASIYSNNDIFTKRNEPTRVEFLKKIIEYIEDPKKLGVNFGEEISK